MRTHPLFGYSLLEVLVALAILVVGLASILTLASMIRQRSVAASELAAAEVACQTTLNELLALQTPIHSFSARPIQGLKNWYLSLTISTCSKPGLAVLNITAYHQTGPETEAPGKTFPLVRWVPLNRIATTEAVRQSEADPF